MFIKESVRSFLSRLFVVSGITATGRKFFPKRGTIILYGHRVRGDNEGYLDGLSPEFFRTHIEYLHSHYEIISLSRLIHSIESDIRLPDNSVVLTFDDGFRDNYTKAFPILREFGLPATIFLVTDSIIRGELPWSQRLGFIVQNTRIPWLKYETATGGRLDFRNDTQRLESYGIVKSSMKKQSFSVREELLEELSHILEVDPPKDRMLTWDQIRIMQQFGIEFGAHTVSHPWMEYLSMEEAVYEMERSKKDIEDHLGVSGMSFAFPGGSYTPALMEKVKSSGFRSVFIKRHRFRINQIDTIDSYSLSRIGLPNGPTYLLESELDGPFHAVRRLYRH